MWLHNFIYAMSIIRRYTLCSAPPDPGGANAVAVANTAKLAFFGLQRFASVTAIVISCAMAAFLPSGFAQSADDLSVTAANAQAEISAKPETGAQTKAATPATQAKVISKPRTAALSGPITSDDKVDSSDRDDEGSESSKPSAGPTNKLGLPVKTPLKSTAGTSQKVRKKSATKTPAAKIPTNSAPRLLFSPVPLAASVDLSQPLQDRSAFRTPQLLEDDEAETESVAAASLDRAADGELAPSQSGEPLPPVKEHLVMLGTEVPPGTSARLSWKPDQSFEGIATPTPVLVINGVKPGPTLCLTAAIHGDELNGIEIVRRVLYALDEKKLNGTVIGVPIVNIQGFHRTSRYLPDRRDLNRYFPGNTNGSSASRIAYSFFNEVIRHCDALVDLHTGSFHRTNLPQVRANLTDPGIVDLSQSFGATVVLHSKGQLGTLRRAAADAGIPSITLEAGEPMRLQLKAVNHGVKSIETLLNKKNMYHRMSFWGEPQPVFYRSRWIRADQGGILFSEVKLGERVDKGELLGTVTDPITNVRSEIYSPFNGRVLGHALNQVVMPGFAAFRIGIEAADKGVIKQLPDEGETPEETEENKELEAAEILRRARAQQTAQDDIDDALEVSE